MQTVATGKPNTSENATRFGGHSMVAKLRTVIVRRPAAPAAPDNWTDFGYLHPVDHADAEREHATLRQILSSEVETVIEVGPDQPGALDAIFAYDPSIVTDAGAVLLRPGKALRLAEVDDAAATYADLGVPVVGRIEAPGTVEGGDTLWIDDSTLAVGQGYRTNAAGIAQLTSILSPLGVTVLTVALPHWRGPTECLHLMSLISPVDTDLAAVYLPLMATSFVQELQSRGWRLIEVPDEEFDSLGCNVLALAPGRCLALEGNPVTRDRLEAAGCDVLTYEGAEVSLNRAGGPTCLTRPLWRSDS